MTNSNLETIRALLTNCSAEDRKILFQELRATHLVHEFEEIIGAPAEMILEAVHRAPELTRRMLRGVIADAAFRMNIIPSLGPRWADVTPEGNFAYDYKLEDDRGSITVQVKLQRSEKGAPATRIGAKYNFGGQVFIVETQKTRSGTDSEDNKTRPYRYGEFDILAVSMQPSTGKWDRYMYTLGRWLLTGDSSDEMATIQPVTMEPSDFWTDNFDTAAAWFYADDNGRRMTASSRSPRKGTKRSKE